MCFSAEFREVEVFPSGSWPITGEDAGVGACGLSIKLDGQRVDGDGYVGVEEALHVKRTREKGGLGEVFVLLQGEEGVIKVPIWNEEDDVAAWVGAKREDPRGGSVDGRGGAVMAGVESSGDARAI